MLNTPVLFVIFNRPNTTQQVFDSIRRAKPKQLFVAADGPRTFKIGETEHCLETRNIVLNNIDWDCDVHTLFREHNLGSGPAVGQAIDWFFSQVDMGIILEDDCLPDDTFFEFAAKMLEYYEDNDSIMHVSGCNSQCGIRRSNASYYFSHIPATWGWATWKRAWNKYSFDFYKDSNEDIMKVLLKNYEQESDVQFFFNEIQNTKNKVVSAWDYQWLYTLLKAKSICITPQYNLIKNLGFNSQGTHTFSTPYWYKYIVNRPINKIIFNDIIKVNKSADAFYLDLTMGRRTLFTEYIKSLYKIKSFFKL